MPSETNSVEAAAGGAFDATYAPHQRLKICATFPRGTLECKLTHGSFCFWAFVSPQFTQVVRNSSRFFLVVPLLRYPTQSWEAKTPPNLNLSATHVCSRSTSRCDGGPFSASERPRTSGPGFAVFMLLDPHRLAPDSSASLDASSARHHPGLWLPCGRDISPVRRLAHSFAARTHRFREEWTERLHPRFGVE